MACNPGKGYGQKVDTRRKMNRPIGIEVFGIEPIDIDGLVVPVPDKRVRVYERSVSGLKTVGGHHGIREWTDWFQSKPQPKMGRHDLMAEAIEEHMLLAEVKPEIEPIVEMVQLQSWSPELDPDFMSWYHGFMDELAEDAFWRTFEQRLVDETDDQDLAADIVEVMGVEYFDIEEPIGYDRIGYRGDDLGDDFDDPEWENPLGSLLN